VPEELFPVPLSPEEAVVPVEPCVPELPTDSPEPPEPFEPLAPLDPWPPLVDEVGLPAVPLPEEPTVMACMLEVPDAPMP
jgi:hypothetical protein